MEKKGEMNTINIILVIIIGVIVLIFLIYGFSSEWKMFRGTTKSYTSSNIDTTINSCNLHCTSNEKYSFCSLPKSINFGKEIQYQDKKITKISKTCKELAEEFSQQGFKPCPNLC